MGYSVTSWTAIIPSRLGSKGLPKKNTRVLAGRPLYRHAVELALAAGASRVVVTTDIPDVLSAKLPPGCDALLRPGTLTQDTTPMAPVLAHAIATAGIVGTVVLLQPTSPLRQVQDVADCLACFASGRHELVISVTEADCGVLKWGRLQGDTFVPLSDPAYCFANRQSLPPVYRPNGAVYVFHADWFMQQQSLVSQRIGVVVMPPERSYDIDTLADFERCDQLLSLNS